jgi:diguanylate cyclase (GGDEF)-like protein
VGDRVLQETSKQVNNTLRDYDLVARIEKATYEVKDKGAGKVGDEMAGRIGGEEFAVVLPVPIKEAIRVAERLRKNVEQNCRFYIRGENDVVNMSETPGLINEYDPGRIINLTVSIGVTSLDHSGIKDKDQLCAKADEALYRAKNSGRNKTVSYRRSQSTSSK